MGYTLYAACTPGDVAAFLQDEVGFDATSQPRAGTIGSFIVAAEGDFFDRTGTIFGKPVLITEEVHDLEAERSRYPDLFDGFLVRRPIHLLKKPLVPFQAARNHKIELFLGSATAVAGSPGAETWDEWVATKTYGRTQDYWADYQKAILYIRKSFIVRRDALARITYEVGFVPPTLTGALGTTDTTIPVSDTRWLQNRGWIRIGDEYIAYSAKSTSAGPGNLTGCQRGYFATVSASHASGDEVYGNIPDGYRQLIIKRAATLFLQNERYSGRVGEESEGYGIKDAVEQWEKDWESEIANKYSAWRNVA
jgi:hypothetical protein